jgi:hypothetical protein
MVYSKNQTKIVFFGKFNENKLNYICDHEMSIAKRATNTTKNLCELHVTDKKQ